jgi:hypothetical protein
VLFGVEVLLVSGQIVYCGTVERWTPDSSLPGFAPCASATEQFLVNAPSGRYELLQWLEIRTRRFFHPLHQTVYDVAAVGTPRPPLVPDEKIN